MIFFRIFWIVYFVCLITIGVLAIYNEEKKMREIEKDLEELYNEEKVG